MNARIFLCGLICLGVAGVSIADTYSTAQRIHNRLAGVPASPDVLSEMVDAIQANDTYSAAMKAMEHPGFCNSTLKSYAVKTTNQDASSLAPLNDAAALIIGMIRDEKNYSHVLSADLAYIGTPLATDIAYSQTHNDHYADLQQQYANLCDPSILQATTQSGLPDSMLLPQDTAGFMTTRAAAEAYFQAGTNRAMFRFTSMNFLCRDLEAYQDVSTVHDRIRVDVTRRPGNDSRLFLTQCLGCHAGMDALAGAYAYYEWDTEAMRLLYTPGEVQGKFLIGTQSSSRGYVTQDDSWVNHWRQGKNALLGWSEALPKAGYGAKSLGKELAQSDAFAQCQVEKSFETICYRKPTSLADKQEALRIAATFKDTGYNMKQIFADTAAYCLVN